MNLSMYQVDAFTSRVLGGNPAAVVPLDQWLEETLMQSIAAENNLSETAFLIPAGEDYHLRWFTPTHEVPLCGHATLASAFVVFSVLEPSRSSVCFETLSGRLEVRKGEGGFLEMEFPRYAPAPCQAPAELLDGLSSRPREVLSTQADPNYYAVYNTERQVRALHPDLASLARLHPYGVAVTAPGEGADFVSRYFAPSYGIPEDPVTGSIHCALVPYWAARLGKNKLHARQVSKRGGELYCQDLPEAVLIAGQAAQYLVGELSI
jgi:PhzF family phenazine biosynthesis protein